MRSSSGEAVIRTARAADAPAISALYRDAYSPRGGGEAREFYPFPQFLDPDWVAAAVVREEIRWLVAETDGAVAGTVGAVLNIGTASDRVAESFGLVISERARGRGTGIRLFDSLCRSLEGEAQFIIGETRTAHPGGWKIVRRCGFVPLGFEPFAHHGAAPGAAVPHPSGEALALAASGSGYQRGVPARPG
jgi:L-amino acid N-acyltransferase YncA